ncbi:hypothetical protein GCM10009754_07150 [Amycolatopsis minnesotensis]|uniref:Transcription elongation factor GreA/GreB C-terminal domain-containing protein n=2 Tax=Amycolatopsis minnesotensis TaxID=337894 RepID=A0ABN2Q5B7_9PSEU
MRKPNNPYRYGFKGALRITRASVARPRTSSDTRGMGSRLSAQARRELEEELTRLRAQRASNASPQDERGMAGDSADQADVLERSEHLAWLDRRITEISELLTYGPADNGFFPDGTTVKLKYEDGSEETLRLMTVAGEDGELTADSPLGKALQGRAKGDKISYQTPGGTLTATVLALDPPD